MQAKEKYKAAQRADPSDASTSEALSTVDTVRHNLEAGNSSTTLLLTVTHASQIHIKF